MNTREHEHPAPPACVGYLDKEEAQGLDNTPLQWNAPPAYETVRGVYACDIYGYAYTHARAHTHTRTHITLTHTQTNTRTHT